MSRVDSSYDSVENGRDRSQSPDSRSLRSGRLARMSSFAAMRDSVMWLGEQAQTQFLERNLEAHANSMRPVSSIDMGSYNSFDNNFVLNSMKTIRFQVIVWSIGCPDVKNNTVSMKFRVTLFWNDRPPLVKEETDNSTKKKRSMWVMAGRSTALKKKISESPTDTVDIPPISILNADSFDVIGQPEIQLLREDSGLMRWSCMYRAQLRQEEMRVNEFPHDTQNLSLKLGILSDRQPGGRWDRSKWNLGLANESDTQGSIRIPYGLIVDHVKVPEFEADKSGLEFGLSELKHGSSAISTSRHPDFYLQVSLKVTRESGYYDKNIMPLLSALNLVSIGMFTLDAEHYFQRGLLCLNIAFVEVGLRMTFDSHLPSVSYQIKLQRIMNFYFYSILSIVLESSVLHRLIENGVCSVESTRKIDLIWAVFLLANQAYLTLVYTSFDRFHQMMDDLDDSL